MSLNFRLSTIEDIPALLKLADEARAIMRSSGNINQWVNGYPSREVFVRDIEQGHGYVVTDDDGDLVATFAFIPSPEPTYAKIYEGQWLDNDLYYVIHRIASTQNSHGVLNEIIAYCFTITRNIRIDTHRDNVIMRHLLKKLGFAYCGIIYLADGAERLAFQRHI